MTVISLFLPILVLLLAFVAVSSNDRVQWWRIGLSGFLSGSAIVGMHYLGNLSVENYRCEYSVGTIVGAALIAVVASTAALALFFVLQAAWTISWWRKILCAMLLAAAVSGMHWCGAVGTRYRLLRFYSGKGDMSRETTIVVVICLVRTSPSYAGQGRHVLMRGSPLRLLSSSLRVLFTLPGPVCAMLPRHSRSLSLQPFSTGEGGSWSTRKGCFLVRSSQTQSFRRLVAHNAPHPLTLRGYSEQPKKLTCANQ